MQISLQFSGAGNAGWTPSSDIVITGFSVSAGTNTKAALSYDEAVSITSILTPSVTTTDLRLIAVGASNVAAFDFTPTPVSAGQSVFVSAQAALTATIYFDSAEIP